MNFLTLISSGSIVTSTVEKISITVRELTATNPVNTFVVRN
jgi:hypothetical protein